MAIASEPVGPGQPRRGRVWALVYLVAAAAAALGTAVLLTRYMDSRVAAVQVPTRRVVVAAADLPPGTVLRPELLAAVEWPVASLPDGAVPDPQELTDQVVGTALAKGEPVLRWRLASGATGRSALASQLAGGMRAVAVRVDEVTGVAGFVHPGDRVDVIVTMKFSDAGDVPFTSKIILQNVKVMSVGKELEDRGRDPQKPLTATVATLMVDSEQAEMLALAVARGQILLALRGGADNAIVVTAGVAPQGLLHGSTSAAEHAARAALAQRLAKAPPVVVRREPAPPPPARDVEILRGDLIERRDFQKGFNP